MIDLRKWVKNFTIDLEEFDHGDHQYSVKFDIHINFHDGCNFSESFNFLFQTENGHDYSVVQPHVCGSYMDYYNLGFLLFHYGNSLNHDINDYDPDDVTEDIYGSLFINVIEEYINASSILDSQVLFDLLCSAYEQNAFEKIINKNNASSATISF